RPSLAQNLDHPPDGSSQAVVLGRRRLSDAYGGHRERKEVADLQAMRSWAEKIVGDEDDPISPPQNDLPSVEHRRRKAGIAGMFPHEPGCISFRLPNETSGVGPLGKRKESSRQERLLLLAVHHGRRVMSGSPQAIPKDGVGGVATASRIGNDAVTVDANLHGELVIVAVGSGSAGAVGSAGDADAGAGGAHYVDAGRMQGVVAAPERAAPPHLVGAEKPERLGAWLGR